VAGGGTLTASPATPRRSAAATPLRADASPVASVSAAMPAPASRPAPVVEAPAPIEAAPARPSLPADWSRLPWEALIELLPLKGMARMLAVHAAAEHLSPEAIALVVDEDHETCVSERTTRELEQALRAALNPALKLSVRIGHVAAPTPLMRMDERRSQAQAAAEHAAEHDPVMLGLKATFGARVIPGSVRPPG
jgi:DNA polymerase-3 subunit gamma/tau